MDSDLTVLLLGAVVGITASIVGYCINHALNLRERRIIREYDIREKGRDYFHQIYGMAAVLSDLTTSFLQDEKSDRGVVLVETGYTFLQKKEIIKRYKQNYEIYAKSWWESRLKGLEVYATKDLASHLEWFWAFAGYFYETEDWVSNDRLIRKFQNTSQQICDEIDKLLGISSGRTLFPQWLNPRKWSYILRGGKID